MAVTRDPNAAAIGFYQQGSGTTATITISTTNPSVIICDFTDGAFFSTATLSSPHLTWTHHTDSNGSAQTIRRFFAVASGALTSEVITITGLASAFSRGTASAYNGVNTSSPFDSGGPQVSANGPDPINITTANASTMLIAYFTCTTPTAAGSGWTIVHSISSDFACSEDQATSSTGTFSASLGTGGTGTASGIIVDALVAAATVLPNNQFDFTPAKRFSRAKPDLSFGLNPNLFKNPVPNNQYDWSKPFNIPQAPWDRSVPLNPNLFKNPYPIWNGDQSWSKVNPDWLPKPEPGINPNIFTNPFPVFNGDQSNAGKINPDWAPVFVPPLNINTFTNPYPFLNIDTSPSHDVRFSVLVDQVYNPNLYIPTVTILPFSQVGVPPPFPVPIAPAEYYNTVLVDFTQPVTNLYDYQAAVRVRSSAPLDQPYNPNLYTTVQVTALPFNQYDVPRGIFYRARPQPDQQFNPNLLANPVPFNQFDYSTPRRITALPWQDRPYNPNLQTNPIPSNQSDFAVAHPLRPSSSPDQAYNLNLYGAVVVTFPLNQYNFPPAVRAAQSLPSQVQALNPNIFTNPLPFNQFDYPRQSRVPTAPFDWSVPTNLNLFKNPVPFAQYDWSVPRRVINQPPAQTGLNLALVPLPPVVGVPALAFCVDIPVFLAQDVDIPAFLAKTVDTN